MYLPKSQQYIDASPLNSHEHTVPFQSAEYHQHHHRPLATNRVLAEGAASGVGDKSRARRRRCQRWRAEALSRWYRWRFRRNTWIILQTPASKKKKMYILRKRIFLLYYQLPRRIDYLKNVYHSIFEFYMHFRSMYNGSRTWVLLKSHWDFQAYSSCDWSRKTWGKRRSPRRPPRNILLWAIYRHVNICRRT